MAVINDPTTAANIVRVGMASGMVWTPQHTVTGPLPVGNGGAFRLAAASGTMAASLGANSEIFQFRFVTGASRVCLVHGISVSAAILTMPAVSTTVAAGPFQLRAAIARAWTAAGSGGTRFTLTGNNQKLRTGHATSEVNDAGISTTGALTAGTKTLDSQDIGSITSSTYLATQAGAVDTSIIEKTNLLGEFSGAMAFPLILVNQEGFVVRIGSAFPATMTWNFTVNVAWSEVDAF